MCDWRPGIAPFTSADDLQLSWLKNESFIYFQDWQESKENSDRTCNKSQKNKNESLSWKTYGGIKIIVNSVIKFLKFLIEHLVPCILTERFCQDLLKNYGVKKDLWEPGKTTKHCVILVVIITQFEIRRYSDELLDEMLFQIIHTKKLIWNLFLAEKKLKHNNWEPNLDVEHISKGYKKKKKTVIFIATYTWKNIDKLPFPW